MVPLQPGAGVHQIGEADRVTLREAVVGEGGELEVDVVGQLAGDPALGHPPVEPILQLGHPGGGPLGPHRPAQLVRLRRVEAGHVDRQLHQLLLEQRHAQRLVQGVGHQRVRVPPLLLLVLAPDVRVHRAALDRAGADQRHLHHQVVELPGFEPGQGGHLRPALHLEHTHRVGPAEHVVDLFVLQVQGAEVQVYVEHVARVVQGGEHAQPEQVELDQLDRGAVVLVPLQHRAPRHPRPLHRAHLHHRPVADHHPAGMDAQVPRERLQLVGVRDDVLGDLLDVDRGDRTPAVDLLAPGVLLAGREPERLGDVPHRRARPVRDHVGHLGGVLPAVLLIDVLDDLLAAVGLDVHIDVGRPVPLRSEEPLEEQPVRNSVHIGYPQCIADRGVRRRAAPLAVDVLFPAELHDVVHDEEVAGEVQLLDHLQLAVELVVRLRRRRARAVPLQRPVHGQLAQPLHLGVPGRFVPVVRQLRRDHPQVEGELPAVRRGPRHRARVRGEPGRHLRPAAQVRGGRGGQPAVHLVQAAPRAYRGQRGGQPAPARSGVVHVVGGHGGQPGPLGQYRQPVVAFVVARVALVGQLHRHVFRAEERDQSIQLCLCFLDALGEQRRRYQTLAAPGQHQHVAGEVRGDLLQVVLRAALLLAGQLRLGDRPGQLGVPLRAARQHQQMPTDRIGYAVLRSWKLQRQLGAEDGAQPRLADLVQLADRLGEPDHAVEPVVVGDGQRFQPQPGRLLNQLLRMAGPVQETEVGVTVQLGVGHGVGRRADLRRLVGRPLAGPGRRVAAVGVHRERVDHQRAGPAGEPPLHLRPRQVRAVPAHGRVTVLRRGGVALVRSPSFRWPTRAWPRIWRPS